jgi:diguanylate cyclase (GGDEF)-like protein
MYQRGNAHVLIIDDDALLRSMAARTLRHAGFDVSETASGEEGLVRMVERGCDLVLLDVMMPGLDGYEVCRRIRAAPEGASVPILMLTGLNDTASIELAYGHGATDFITKPINWTLLSHKVRYALRASTAAHYDAATGLPNRKFFAELAGPSLERAARSGSGCAVMHVDIDRFKGVNDAFGRGQGDVVLKTVAERLRAWTRNSDLAAVDHGPADRGMLASVGGNAFSLLITDVAGQEQATVVAQRLLRAIAEPIIVESQSLVLTASIGIAFYPNDAHDFSGLARCAEQAVHAAKEAGRAQYRFFDEQMNARAASRLLQEADLRRAIDQGELRLYFQPKVDAHSRAVVGAEALVRWQHPERGLVPPAEFIAVAEETGLILPLTDWVLECACRNLREWADAGLPALPLSVNLAAPCLAGVALVGKLDTLMQRFGLEPRHLMLEMTESILMHDVESGVLLLQTLRSRGYGLSLDDFGTGYSSLSYLKRLPLDELKIDRAFVIDAARGGRDGALAAAIIALGRELGLQVVAEGVETLEQSAYLLRRGCPLQQGYLFSRPVPSEDYARMLSQGLTAQARARTRLE